MDLVTILPSVVAILAIIISYLTVRMQIKTSKETAELNFKQNVLSNNRRDWIETFRQEVSQFLSMCVSISLNVGRSGYEVEDIKNLSKNISSLQLICYSLDSNSDKDSFLKELKIL